MARGIPSVKRTFLAVGLVWSICFVAMGADISAPSTEPTPVPEPAQLQETQPPGESAPQKEPEKADTGARMFTQKCAGCHTIGGGALTGPDLKAVQSWPKQNVDPAILRMEKNVGKLKPEDIQVLAELLLAPDAANRIAEERKRIAMQEMAKLEPASAAVGEAIFYGSKPLTNRGLACASCHAVNGRGGNLSFDLTGSFAKLGEVPLASTIEGVTFPLMQAAYKDNQITKQETI
ncbi:MAG: cytochrome c, partial [Candidatus Hydrogenedentes bacterium]|nr:cytochrome c [Candidatus Hydrogenedentota bacterium]